MSGGAAPARRLDLMRVVFVTHNYPRYAGDLAGVFLHPLALALRDRGHDVRVVAPSDAGQGGLALEQHDGISVRRVRYAAPRRERYAYTGRMQEALGSPAGWLAMLGLVRALRRGARAELAGATLGVVHAHWWFPAGLAAPAVPSVVTLHGTDARLLDRWGGVAGVLARRALRPGRVVTAVSHAVAASAERATGRAVDAAHISPMPIVGSVPPPSEGGGGLIFIGRLTKQKRVDLALDAHARLVALGRSVAFTIVGDGPERPALQARAAGLGLGALARFVGQVPPDGVAEALRRADAMIFSAEQEGFGLAAVEAISAGVPVVACRDGGGILDILAEPGAGVVTEPVTERLAAEVGALLDNPVARAHAARAGAAWRDRLSPSRVAERCERWYLEASRG